MGGEDGVGDFTAERVPAIKKSKVFFFSPCYFQTFARAKARGGKYSGHGM